MSRVYVDIDLDEFDDDEIVDAAIGIAMWNKRFKEQIFDALKLVEVDSVDSVLNVISIRDEQYIEVFEQLKEKFTVSELEQLLTTK